MWIPGEYLGEYLWSSGYGRRPMTEKSWVQTPHFSCTIHLDQSMEAGEKPWSSG
jgi:hypothetical protein